MTITTGGLINFSAGLVGHVSCNENCHTSSNSHPKRHPHHDTLTLFGGAHNHAIQSRNPGTPRVRHRAGRVGKASFLRFLYRELQFSVAS